jgi:hypothetical protein
MTDVGILGGMLNKRLGTPAEVAAFFALIDQHKSKSSDGALNLVTDRLFRRTVAGEQYDQLVEQLAQSRELLEEVRISDGFWDQFALGDRAVGIDRSATNAAEAFQKIFDSLERAIDAARLDEKNLGYFRPLRLVAWESRKHYEHEEIPLEEFEKPDIQPIWLE